MPRLPILPLPLAPRFPPIPRSASPTAQMRSSHAPKAADAVLFAETAEDIQRAVAICQTRLPIIPFGAGSSLEGRVIPGARGALSIDTSAWTKF